MTPQEVAEELTVDCSMVIQHLKQIEKVKNLNKWGPGVVAQSLSFV